MTQKYLIDYQVINNAEPLNAKTAAVNVYNRFTYARSTANSDVMKAINAHKERGTQVLRAWAVEWMDPNAKYRLVIGDPANSPAEPGTIYLKQVRAANERSKKASQELIVVSEQRVRENRERLFADRVRQAIASVVEEKPAESRQQYYKPYPDPVVYEEQKVEHKQ